MEFRQLTYFLAAAQTQNFRKAADLCLVAQSALSRQIAALEDELGVELFRRVNQRVVLTGAGREFAVYARGALEQLQKGQHAMVELEAGERGTVVIGCVEALATAYLPGVFARFNAAHPHVRIQVAVAGTDDLLQAVEQGELDFGLVFGPSSVHSELLVVHELFRQPIQLIVGKQHPLAQLRDPTPLLLEDVRQLPMVMLTEGFGIRRIMEALFNRRGWPLQPLAEVASVEALKEFVKQGVGLSFMPTALLRPEQIGQEIIMRPLADLNEEFPFALIYRRIGSLSMAARGLIEAIKS